MDINYFPVVITLFSCHIAILVLYPYAIKVNLVDEPCKRKQHTGYVPLIGGVAMFIAVTAGMLSFPLELSQYKFHFVSCIILVSMGVLDDYRGLSVQIRLFLQVVAILIISEFAGDNLSTLGNLVGDGDVMLDNWSRLFTILAIVGVMNSLNMIDGIDGLAGFLSLLTFLAIAYLSYIAGDQHHLIIALIFCAALVPFLFSNSIIKTKKIFMGDAGSMFLGLGISLLLIRLTQGESRAFAPVTALWIFALPLIDTIAIILRRMKNNDSPFKADRNHIHHVFIRMGLSDNQTLFLLVTVSGIMILIGVWSEIAQVAEWKMFIAFILISAVYFTGILYVWRVVSFIRKIKENF